MNDDRTLKSIDVEFGMTPTEVEQMRKDIQYGRISPPIRVVIVKGNQNGQTERYAR